MRFRLRRRHALVLIAALVLTIVPVSPGFALETAPPETVHAVMEDLPDAAEPSPLAEEADVAPATSPASRTTGHVDADVPFSMIGFDLPARVDEAQVRTRDLDGEWSDWETLHVEEVGIDGPDLDTAEAREAKANVTEPLWVGAADAFEVMVEGDPTEVAATLIDTEGLSETMVAKAVRWLTPRPALAPAQAAPRPNIITRSQWGANESLRRGGASYANPRFAVLHHTAGSNTYTRAQSAAVVRGIYSYHTQANGWNDIGYNILIDRYGQVFEGRHGGLERGVVGAHAAGFNSGSFGVGVMGNFDVAQIPTAAFNRISDVIAWKYDLHGINARANGTVTASGRTLRTLVGHRDVGSTACPGRYLYARMGTIRSQVASKSTGSSASSTPTTFRDVPASHTHFRSIEWIAQRGITRGCSSTQYCPQRNVTRAEMATFMVRSFNIPATSRRPFSDVSGTHAANISALHRSGLTQGCAPGRYCPNRAVSRGEMASFLARALGLRNRTPPFSDSRNNTHAGPIGALAHAGIVVGDGGRYRPNDPVTRAEMASMLARSLR